MKICHLAQAVKALMFVGFAFATQSGYAQTAPLLCAGQLTHTFPGSKKQTFALYYLSTRQRYPGDCFTSDCPAKCPFDTAEAPANEKVVDKKEIKNPKPPKEADSK